MAWVSYPCVDKFDQLRGFILGKLGCIKGTLPLSIENLHRQPGKLVGTLIHLQ